MQMFSAKLPRGSNCLVCHANKLTGLSGLPKGGHLVLAPYATGRQDALPAGGGLGGPLRSGSVSGDAGFDAKWTPNATNAIDATLRPDFSQVESDVAQIATNQRFALFYPEKRPFFLEGLELLSTPIQAVYTRTITTPRWGVRATGQLWDTSYTALVADDRGGGSVVLPGPQSSGLAPQDFASRVVVGRLRRDFGQSFASFLLTDREVQGGGYNRVWGPDFQWRPTAEDSVTGELLLSSTETPLRSNPSPTGTGRRLDSYGANGVWTHSTRTYDWIVQLSDFGDGFRSDLGFVPQVGYREERAGAGYQFYPENPVVNRVHPFVGMRYSTDTDGNVLLSRVSPGINLGGIWRLGSELDYNIDRVRIGNALFSRRQLVFSADSNPSRLLAAVGFDGFIGQEGDFDNGRMGRGGTINLRTTIRPTDHLELHLNGSDAWLDVDSAGRRSRLFTARLARLRATYNFTARMYLRLIVQRLRVERDPGLYLAAVTKADEALTQSVLFAYRIDWQTVLFAGYGGERDLLPSAVLAPASRSFFVKVSYAFQR
nr:DUF5916 domain-containing protein [Acidobacteriota bacterium]